MEMKIHYMVGFQLSFGDASQRDAFGRAHSDDRTLRCVRDRRVERSPVGKYLLTDVDSPMLRTVDLKATDHIVAKSRIEDERIPSTADESGLFGTLAEVDSVIR